MIIKYILYSTKEYKKCYVPSLHIYSWLLELVLTIILDESHYVLKEE